MQILRWIILCGALICGASPAPALDMNVGVENDEKLVHVNMWGKIEQGDDEKFRSLVLPYLRKGFLIFEVSIFSPGGNVKAAMSLGTQIRMLQSITETSYKEVKIINNRRVVTGRAMCSFREGDGAQLRFAYDREWCNCASACILIWASGAVRNGGHIGIHRPYYQGAEFGQLTVSEARARYQALQDEYSAYLKGIDVPQTILDRLFATDSRSMYYLAWPEIQLMNNTPYLEEMVYSRCGRSKHVSMSAANGWRSTEDPKHVACYRSILKELMKAGAKEYLVQYGH